MMQREEMLDMPIPKTPVGRTQSYSSTWAGSTSTMGTAEGSRRRVKLKGLTPEEFRSQSMAA